MDFSLFPPGPGPGQPNILNVNITGGSSVPSTSTNTSESHDSSSLTVSPPPPPGLTLTRTTSRGPSPLPLPPSSNLDIINQLWFQKFNNYPIPDLILRPPPLYSSMHELVWLHPSGAAGSFHQLILDTQVEDFSETEPEPEVETEGVLGDDYLHHQHPAPAAPVQHQRPAVIKKKPIHSSSSRSTYKFSPGFVELFQLSLQETLTQNQRQELLDELGTPRLPPEFTPESLAQLVTKNPPIAITLLTNLLELEEDSEVVEEYLNVISKQMDVSVQTMEVVNGLTGLPNLPKHFLHQYISNSLDTLGRSLQNKNRSARLLCIFLTSLLRTRVLEIQFLPQALYYEILAFCIDYSRIREAAALFRYLKELEMTMDEDFGDLDSDLALASKLSLSDFHQQEEEKVQEQQPQAHHCQCPTKSPGIGARDLEVLRGNRNPEHEEEDED